jgi:hypothetical protein
VKRDWHQSCLAEVFDGNTLLLLLQQRILKVPSSPFLSIDTLTDPFPRPYSSSMNRKITSRSIGTSALGCPLFASTSNVHKLLALSRWRSQKSRFRHISIVKREANCFSAEAWCTMTQIMRPPRFQPPTIGNLPSSAAGKLRVS